MKYLLLCLLLLCGCGQTLEQSQMITARPEEPEEAVTYLVSNPQFSSLVFTPDGTYNGSTITTASSLSGSLTDQDLSLTFSEGTATLTLAGTNLDLEDGGMTWHTDTGTLTIVSQSDTQVEIDFTYTGVPAQGGGAAGTFDLAGHLTADLTQL